MHTTRLPALLAAAALATASLAAHAGAFDDYFVTVKRDDASAATTLLNRGVDPNAADARGNTPLMLALKEPSPRVAAVLIQSKRIDPSQRNQAGESALMIAAIKGDLPAARALIARDAAVNQPGWAPLHYAVSAHPEHQLDMVRLLLEHHAFIDAQSPNDTTPLMMAAMYGGEDAARLLVEEGADATMRNQQGMTAGDFARKAGRQKLAAELDARATAQKAGLQKPAVPAPAR